jgi:hypothetical protein
MESKPENMQQGLSASASKRFYKNEKYLRSH